MRPSRRALHERRPDLQFGADLAGQLHFTGRDDEAEALMRTWLERTPDSEQALASQISNDIDRARLDQAVRYARALVFVHGDDPPRQRTLCDVLIASDQLREAGAIADRMLRGAAYDRKLAQLRLGTIAIMEGRFSSAFETLKGLYEPNVNNFGLDATFLESPRALARGLGLTEEALRLGATLEKVYAESGSAVSALGVRFDGELEHGCTSVDAAVGTLPDGPGRASARRYLLRAAAAKGCVPCAEVVRAGLAPVDDNLYSLFQFGVCAESEGALELASDTFAKIRRVRFLGSAWGLAYPAILARYHAARVLERQGNAAGAKAQYEEFLARWGHADRPLAEVDDARQRLARLQ